MHQIKLYRLYKSLSTFFAVTIIASWDRLRGYGMKSIEWYEWWSFIFIVMNLAVQNSRKTFTVRNTKDELLHKLIWYFLKVRRSVYGNFNKIQVHKFVLLVPYDIAHIPDSFCKNLDNRNVMRNDVKVRPLCPKSDPRVCSVTHAKKTFLLQGDVYTKKSSN
jgi:hypothetical protein